jgi:hypothetical protein
MHVVGHQGEIEYILPWKQPFRIIDAQQRPVTDVNDVVLHLVLDPKGL